MEEEMKNARQQAARPHLPPPSDGTDTARQNKIAEMREQQRLRRKQMSGQIDIYQQSDIMKKFEENLL